MDLLGFLKDKNNEIDNIVHPYAKTDNTFKYLYCFGLGVLSCGHMKAMTETAVYFKVILNNIKLHQNYQDKIIIDINNNFDYKINDVFEVLDTKEKQYTFAADLFMLCSNTLWSQSYCEQVRDIYMNIFKFSNGEKEFFDQFCLSAKKNNMEAAKTIYREFIKQEYSISYQLLKYIYHDFLLEVEYETINLANGQHLLIDKPTKVKGNITIRSGASLALVGGELKIEGNIKVDGGRIIIKDASILVDSCTSTSLIDITNSAFVSIESSLIDCNFNCGFLSQNDGHLVITNSKICHTKYASAIIFSGRSLIMNNIVMEDCLQGGVRALLETVMQIDNCEFYNCEADHGGAIYSDSLYATVIMNSKFKNCRAKYIGGAIYFAYKKYGQDILECEFTNCIPENSFIFNCFKDEKNVSNHNEKTFKS